MVRTGSSYSKTRTIKRQVYRPSSPTGRLVNPSALGSGSSSTTTGSQGETIKETATQEGYTKVTTDKSGKESVVIQKFKTTPADRGGESRRLQAARYRELSWQEKRKLAQEGYTKDQAPQRKVEFEDGKFKRSYMGTKDVYKKEVQIPVDRMSRIPTEETTGFEVEGQRQGFSYGYSTEKLKEAPEPMVQRQSYADFPLERTLDEYKMFAGGVGLTAGERNVIRKGERAGSAVISTALGGWMAAKSAGKKLAKREREITEGTSITYPFSQEVMSSTAKEYVQKPLVDTAKYTYVMLKGQPNIPVAKQITEFQAGGAAAIGERIEKRPITTAIELAPAFAGGALFGAVSKVGSTTKIGANIVEVGTKALAAGWVGYSAVDIAKQPTWEEKGKRTYAVGEEAFAFVKGFGAGAGLTRVSTESPSIKQSYPRFGRIEVPVRQEKIVYTKGGKPALESGIEMQTQTYGLFTPRGNVVAGITRMSPRVEGGQLVEKGGWRPTLLEPPESLPKPMKAAREFGTQVDFGKADEAMFAAGDAATERYALDIVGKYKPILREQLPLYETAKAQVKGQRKYRPTTTRELDISGVRTIPSEATYRSLTLGSWARSVVYGGLTIEAQLPKGVFRQGRGVKAEEPFTGDIDIQLGLGRTGTELYTKANEWIIRQPTLESGRSIRIPKENPTLIETAYTGETPIKQTYGEMVGDYFFKLKGDVMGRPQAKVTQFYSKQEMGNWNKQVEALKGDVRRSEEFRPFFRERVRRKGAERPRKTWEHALDIHEKAGSQYGEYVPEGAFGMPYEQGTKILKFSKQGKAGTFTRIEGMRLGESLHRKYGSSFTFTEEGFRPSSYRGKDVTDALTISKEITAKYPYRGGKETQTSRTREIEAFFRKEGLIGKGSGREAKPSPRKGRRGSPFISAAKSATPSMASLSASQVRSLSQSASTSTSKSISTSKSLSRSRSTSRSFSQSFSPSKSTSTSRSFSQSLSPSKSLSASLSQSASRSRSVSTSTSTSKRKSPSKPYFMYGVKAGGKSQLPKRQFKELYTPTIDATTLGITAKSVDWFSARQGLGARPIVR